MLHSINTSVSASLAMPPQFKPTENLLQGCKHRADYTKPLSHHPFLVNRHTQVFKSHPLSFNASHISSWSWLGNPYPFNLTEVLSRIETVAPLGLGAMFLPSPSMTAVSTKQRSHPAWSFNSVPPFVLEPVQLWDPYLIAGHIILILYTLTQRLSRRILTPWAL